MIRPDLRGSKSAKRLIFLMESANLHWSDSVPACLQALGLGDGGEPVLFLGGAHPNGPRPVCDRRWPLRLRAAPRISSRHRDHGGEWPRAWIMDCGGNPGGRPTAFVGRAAGVSDPNLPPDEDPWQTTIAKFAAIHEDISIDVLAVTGALHPARSASSARPYRRGPRPRRTCRLRGDKK